MNTSKCIGRVADLDTRLARAIVDHQGPTAKAVLPRLSQAANHSKLWLAVAGAGVAFGGRRGRRLAQRGLLSVGLASAISNGLLKPLFPRVRPPVDPTALPSIVRRPTSSSFPSGHSASAAAFATATVMEAPAVAAPVAALAAGVAYSRITSGVHYPSDVIVGTMIGAAVATGSTRIWPLTDPTPAAARPAPERSTTEPAPDGKGIVLVVNAAAGPAAHHDDLRIITEALPNLDVVTVEDPTTLSEEFEMAASAGVALGVLGGDGTIGAGAAAALERNIPLVVFPGGTLNHFARDLGVDTISDAIDAVKAGQLVEVDTASIDGRTFLNTASFGSYSDFVEAREKLEDTIGKWPAVAVALAKLLVHGTPFEATIDGERRKIWMIFIGNCAYDPPGFAPASRTRLDDGMLDVRLVDGTEPYARLQLMAAVLSGQLARSKVYSRQLVKRLSVEISDDHPLLAADGETFEGTRTFTVTKSKGRLRTYAPHR